MAGSLTSEVQRVTLREEGAIGSTGTFRLEVGDGLAGGGNRSRVDADHDGRYWTSQLSASSSAEEVRTEQSPPNRYPTACSFSPGLGSCRQ